MQATNHNNSINSAQLLGKNEEHLYYVSGRIAIHQKMKGAFDAMVDAAKDDGIELTIASGFRSFDRQLTLWNNKFSGKTVLAQDYQLQLEPWEYSEQGPLAKLSAWLIQHAHQFGFYFPYGKFQGGVAQEPWHISYLPLAQQYQQAFDSKLLAHTLNNSSILGKKVIIENLDDIANRYINNVCAPPSNVILPEQTA